MVFVDLAPLREHRLVGAKIAWAVGLHETSNQSARDLLLAHLADRQVLLVLDNFEHLLEAGPLLSDILAACPRVAMLVTSRARLGLRGEQRFIVDALASPAADPDQSLATIAATSAVRLFVDRAREVSPTFALTADNATAVGRDLSSPGRTAAVYRAGCRTGRLAVTRGNRAPPGSPAVPADQRSARCADPPADIAPYAGLELRAADG